MSVEIEPWYADKANKPLKIYGAYQLLARLSEKRANDNPLVIVMGGNVGSGKTTGALIVS